MKLRNTMMCINCEEVMNAGAKACPACSGTRLYPLLKWMGSCVLGRNDRARVVGGVASNKDTGKVAGGGGKVGESL